VGADVRDPVHPHRHRHVDREYEIEPPQFAALLDALAGFRLVMVTALAGQGAGGAA
jgi:hypothetical protein